MKPLSVSILARPFEFRQRTMLGFSGLVCVELTERARVFTEAELWALWATRPESAAPLEEGIPRIHGEYLVSGIAYPHASDGRACAVAARCGQLSKQLLVFGDRAWEGDRPTPARPFAALPLTWARSWGGEGVPENPLGCGAAPVERDGVRLHPLPNVEDPRQPLASPRDRVRTVGFGPIDPMWPQRMRHQGTYDDDWLKTQFPAVAADTDWRYFNVAPEDQQQAEPFAGTEEYAFQNLHPTQPLLAGRLPGLRVRGFATQRVAGVEKFREIRTRLNTLWFFPDVERAILVFQGMHEIAEDDGSDIIHLLAALEHADQPRPAAHYLQVRDKRLDKDNGLIESLREEDLMPADLVVPLVDFTPRKNRALERGLQRAEIERARVRDEVARHGLDPDEHAPPVQGEPVPEVRTVDDLLRLRHQADQRMAQARQQMESERAMSLADARAVFQREGKDFGPIEREMAGLETRGPPRPFVDALLESLHDHIAAGQSNKAGIAELEHMVADEKLHAQWRAGEASQLAAYRLGAHLQVPADRIRPDAARALRQRVLAHSGRDFRGWDLTGADLSGLDLSGANFQGALMERANLTGTRLSGANLRDAVLAHADLQSTQFQHAVLVGANLGAARIDQADFEGADLTGALFAKARLSEVNWRGAMLDGIRLEEVQLRGVDCSGARATRMLVFYRLDLRGCSFAGARLAQAVFIECDASGVDFSGAVFEKCAFVTLKAPGACFGGLRIDSGCFAQACELAQADFSGALLSNLSLRGAVLTGAVLRGASLHGSDFSECDLTGADLRGADARAARFVRARLAQARFDGANLTDAVLQHARLEDTDFRHANLFQSDFARVRVAPGVRLDGALRTRMRIYPRHRASAPGEAAG
ncbi:MAG TPA: DUF2169 domain-containing protein [Ottowia sp.]|uniref:DUF2169 family type VI secretion system accessory protein n=1 Tax=Ottowia sp. TaxID=1898956 RepID=UPI002D018F33|nr:DUF2169 domain-containing protein [Ottowia sp.]HMN20137.1 DUF2169 domain-containing protein [Ottowia sp.]